MSAFDVDIDHLRSVVASLAACQGSLIDLAGGVDAEAARLHDEWSGLARDASVASYGAWRAGLADMVTALAGLRGVADTAGANYAAAVGANLAMWHQVQ